MNGSPHKKNQYRIDTTELTLIQIVVWIKKEVGYFWIHEYQFWLSVSSRKTCQYFS